MSEPANATMQRIRESLIGRYDLLGELGSDEHGEHLYLAREIATGALVGVSLSQDTADGSEFTVEVRRTLGETVAVHGSVCPECSTPLPDLERFCFQCGADLSGVLAVDGTPEATRVLAALATATSGRFDILGRMDRDGKAGTVYFARELTTDKIVALRLRRAEANDAVQAEYVVRQTQVFRAVTSPKPVATPAQPAFPPTRPMDAGRDVGMSVGETSIAVKPVWMRTPVLLGGVSALIALIGFFSLRDIGEHAATTAAVPVKPAASVPTPTESTPTPAPIVASPSVVAIVDSGTIRIVTALPTGARLTLDGRIVTGRALRTSAGSHQLSVTATGYETATQRVTVGRGSNAQWAPRLVSTTVVASVTPPKAAPAAEPKRRAPSCKESMKAEEWAVALTQCQTDANNGDANAAMNVARIYARGLSTKSDLAAALTWYTKAALGGDRDAASELGYAYRDGLGTKRDASQGVRWFKQAADFGDRSAQMEYAVALEKGDGVSRDEHAAREWFKKSADQGSFLAARRLGRMLERGAGGPKSEQEAAAMYERAATLGDAESALTIGRWYRDGKNVIKSSAQALMWFRKAAELGNDDANKEIRRLEKGE